MSARKCNIIIWYQTGWYKSLWRRAKAQNVSFVIFSWWISDPQVVWYSIFVKWYILSFHHSFPFVSLFLQRDVIFNTSHTVWSTPVPLGSNTMTGASQSFWTHHNLPQGSNTALQGGTSVSREGRVVIFSAFAWYKRRVRHLLRQNTIIIVITTFWKQSQVKNTKKHWRKGQVILLHTRCQNGPGCSFIPHVHILYFNTNTQQNF